MRGARARGAAAAAAAAVVALGAVAGGLVLGWRALDRTHPFAARPVAARTAAVVEYLQRTPGDAPVIFAVDKPRPISDYGVIPAFRRIRAAAPAALVPRILTYPGDPRELLAGRPTLRPGDEAFNRVSLLYWERIAPLAAEEPIVVAMAPYYPRVRALLRERPDWELAPGVALLRGPRPPAPLEVGPGPAPPTTGALARDAALVLALLAGAGLGWGAALLGGGWATTLPVAPALGLAALVLTGVVAGTAGVALRGAAAWGVAAAAALPGWAAAAAGRFRERRAAASAREERAAAD